MSFFRLLAVIVSAVLAFGVSSAFASSGTVHVNGYTRTDGTYVAPHDRSAPNSTKADNWSTKGNVNPETGKEGTKNVPSTSAATTAPSPTPAQASASAAPTTSTKEAATATPPQAIGWKGVRAQMPMAEIEALLGKPNLKTAGEWRWSRGGLVRFDDKGVVVGFMAPQN